MDSQLRISSPSVWTKLEEVTLVPYRGGQLPSHILPAQGALSVITQAQQFPRETAASAVQNRSALPDSRVTISPTCRSRGGSSALWCCARSPANRSTHFALGVHLQRQAPDVDVEMGRAVTGLTSASRVGAGSHRPEAGAVNCAPPHVNGPRDVQMSSPDGVHDVGPISPSGVGVYVQ